MNPADPGILAIVLYAVGSYSQIRTLAKRTPAPTRGLAALSVPAIALHGIYAALVLDTELGIDLSLFNVGAVITLAMTLAVVIASLRRPVENLYLFVFPLSVLMIGASLATSPTATPRTDIDAGLLAHIVISMFAYSILTLSACQAALVLVLEGRIRHGGSIGLVRILPPLETMELVLFQWLWAGLALLTVSIVTGFVFLADQFSDQVSQHHTVFSIASWLVYAALLGGHRLFGWRGATTTRWSLGAFCLLMLGYFGTKFVIEFLLERG